MKLLTKALEAKLPPLHSTEDGGKDIMAVVKFFTPDASWTWYAVEYDPVDKLFFGLVCGFETELGYFGLDQLESVRGPLGLRIERDIYFEPVPLYTLLPKRRTPCHLSSKPIVMP